MFIGRRQDGTIYGCWTTRQRDDADHPQQEEVPDDHPDLLAFLAPKPPDPRVVEDEAQREACKADGAVATLINMDKAECLAWAGANLPSLTPAERQRMGLLIWMQSVALRRLMR